MKDLMSEEGGWTQCLANSWTGANSSKQPKENSKRNGGWQTRRQGEQMVTTV